MKFSGNWELLYTSRNKLIEKNELSSKEKESLIQFLNETEGELYPSKEDLVNHQRLLKELDGRKDYNSRSYNQIYDQICEFEGKYC